MSKLTAREVRKYLETKPQADLVNDIVAFFNRFDGVIVPLIIVTHVLIFVRLWYTRSSF